MLLNDKLQEVLGLEELYHEVKDKYDILYKELNFEKERKTTLAIAVILGISLLLNVINFIALIPRS